jgi:nicotinamidase/pyrazinamidase
LPKEAIVLSKGMDPSKDSYSAFQAVDNNGSEFLILLQLFGIKELYVGGLATDYCVRASVLDGLKFGFKTYLLIDAIQGVDMRPDDSALAVEQMAGAGALLSDLAKVTNRKGRKGGEHG